MDKRVDNWEYRIAVWEARSCWRRLQCLFRDLINVIYQFLGEPVAATFGYKWKFFLAAEECIVIAYIEINLKRQKHRPRRCSSSHINTNWTNSLSLNISIHVLSESLPDFTSFLLSLGLSRIILCFGRNDTSSEQKGNLFF